MDFKRLAVVLLQRLAPIYIAVALSWVTGYFVFTLGGIGLAIAIELAWPLLRPFFEVLYDELMAQYDPDADAASGGTSAGLLALFPGLQNCPHNLSTTPCSRRLRLRLQRRSRCAPRLSTVSKPSAVQSLTIHSRPRVRRPYEMVRTMSLLPRDFRDWSFRECQTWRQDLLTVLAKGRIAALRHAVQHVMHERSREVWEPYLAEAARALEGEAESTLRRWSCLQRAQTDLAVRERLVTLLRLDSINRQTGLQSYLTAYLQCPPAEIHDVMASIRYDTVAAKLLALMPEPDVPLLPPRRQP